MTIDSEAPLVTVYMPTHSRLNLLPRAVESVLCQTHKNLELIIVDDASQDQTRCYLETLKSRDNRVRTIYLETSKGPSHARNLAIKEAKGEFVTGIDDDDEFSPDRLAVFLQSWDKEYAFITSSLYWDYGQTRKLRGGKTLNIELTDLLSHKHACFHVFTRPQNFITAGLFDETMRNSEDWDMWIRLGLLNKPIKQIEDATYIVHTAHESPRLSLDSKKAIGLRGLIEKHQAHMTTKNKKDMLIRLSIAENRRIPLNQLVTLLTIDNVWLYTKFWIRSSAPSLNDLLRKLTKRSG
jgi:glycosyltransferase involved in cell wall biosynthesis